MLYFSHWHLEVSSLSLSHSLPSFTYQGRQDHWHLKSTLCRLFSFQTLHKKWFNLFVRKMEPQALYMAVMSKRDFLSPCGDSSFRLAEWGWGIDGDYLISLPWEKMLKGRLINGADQPCHRRLSGDESKGENFWLQGHSELCWHFISLTSVQRILGYCPGDEKERMAIVRKLNGKNWPRRPKGRNEFLMEKGRSQWVSCLGWKDKKEIYLPSSAHSSSQVVVAFTCKN